MSESKPKIRMPKEFENILSKPIPIDPLEWFELKAELTRLKELNREVTKELTNLLFDVELSPSAQDRIDKIFDLLARGE